MEFRNIDFTRCTVVILLCGGDKSTQARDIAKAKQLAQELAKEPNGE
jgi:putative addiction module killer protein